MEPLGPSEARGAGGGRPVRAALLVWRYAVNRCTPGARYRALGHEHVPHTPPALKQPHRSPGPCPHAICRFPARPSRLATRRVAAPSHSHRRGNVVPTLQPAGDPAHPRDPAAHLSASHTILGTACRCNDNRPSRPIEVDSSAPRRIGRAACVLRRLARLQPIAYAAWKPSSCSCPPGLPDDSR